MMAQVAAPALEAEVANNATIPEFVRKLFRMLDDPTAAEVVAWSDDGESFVVKDTNEFGKEVLPRHFKHNNFASFVRQLNKYGFHKVKTPPEVAKRYGDSAWEFKHPHFSANNLERLANIRRKAPSSKKNRDDDGRESSPVLESALQATVPAELSSYIQTLSQNYEAVVRELLTFKRNLAAQDHLMQQLLQYLVNKEASANAALAGVPAPPPQLTLPDSLGISTAGATAPASAAQPPAAATLPSHFSTPTLPSHYQQAMLDALTGGANSASAASSAAAAAPAAQPSAAAPSPNAPSFASPSMPAMWSPADLPSLAVSTPLDAFGNVSFPQLSEASLAAMDELSRRYSNNGESLTVTTVGMLRPRDTSAAGAAGNGSGSGSMRVVRSTFVPSWSVPPKVLLVEDDATCRMVASKLLQVFGCTFEIAHDGMEAVNKMNLDKYDIVLMDIVMPNMDGISATTQIRQFDPATPVISMTSNTSRDDCLRYLENGMTDILRKPFSKESLLAMLERYCSHLTGLFQTQFANRLIEQPGIANITEQPDDDGSSSAAGPSAKRLKQEPASAAAT